MANDMNQVTLIGRLTKDSELKYTQSGTAVARFTIASNKKKKDSEEVSFFDIVAWGKLAENLNNYLTKGKQVALCGELRQNRWEQDGQKRSKIEVIAYTIQLLGNNQHPAGQQQQGFQQPQGFQQQGFQQPQQQPMNSDGTPDFQDDFPW